MNWISLTKQEKAAQVAHYVPLGLTASQIAGKFENCSRSAIIGCAHRNGLQVNGGSNQATRKVSPKKPVNPPRPNKKHKPLQTVTKPYRPLNGKGIPFMDRARKQCAWILNDPADGAMCCGNIVDKDFWQPYCEHHAEESRGKPGSGGMGRGGWVK